MYSELECRSGLVNGTPLARRYFAKGQDLHHSDRGSALDCVSALRHSCPMTRAIACSLLCVAMSFALPACNTCNRGGCDSLGTPAVDNGKSEIAGTIASESDAGNNGCFECPFASATLSIWSAPGPVSDAASAKAIIKASPAAVALQADARYRQALDPGSYLFCASYESVCVSIDVVAGHVTPVNLRLLFGPFQFMVFDPQTRALVSATMLYPGA